MLLCWLSRAQLIHSRVLYAHSDKQSLSFLYVYYRCIESVSFLNTICDRFIAMLAILEYCTSLKDKKFNFIGLLFWFSRLQRIHNILFSALFIVQSRHFYRLICPTSFNARTFFSIGLFQFWLLFQRSEIFYLPSMK